MKTEGAGARWSTSSYSNGEGACVEVALGDTVGARDTKHHGTGPELWVSADGWRAFLAGAVDGELTA
ncbi:DUF397 domain-containing protein [Streptomyces hainanensis]|uniref:DUF397 domain-containing protein n=1 Tax=Streptomyces hainanensis TaxID=402648 RepID=A0A4R4TAE1_9ACTN|nr:DUF397 domain-containing protein [Streptomyces hainanensis]TDC74251.1 DUF397 domain-containing protein [Streptomyces hainanensis]